MIVMEAQAMPMSADDKRWRAEEDARILADAKRIESEPGRLEAATTAAKRMADEEAERTKALRQVASRSKTRKPGAKSKDPLSKEPVNKGAGRKSSKHNVFQRI